MNYRKVIENNSVLTTFDKKVLKAILSIPRGHTKSYKWVAERIGTMGYRAVGKSLGKNPYAPMVPCHRIIRSDGSIGGYSGGEKKKKELLLKEGVKL